MKNKILTFLGQPKVIIPSVFVIAVVVGVVSYRFLGRAPVVNLSDDFVATTSENAPGTIVDLSFPKAGRLASVSVHVGDTVTKGEVLASLDAADASGAVDQAKGALELAKAQYASMNVQYANAKKEQDTLVENAYRTLLSDDLQAFAQQTNPNISTTVVDSSQAPTITGTYTCNKEGSYEIDPYFSGTPSGYSFTYKGLETSTVRNPVTYYTPQPLGSCGLFVQFPAGYNASELTEWIVNIPNTKSGDYADNKNTYDLAVATRDQVLKQLEANIGANGTSTANIAQAAIDAAEGTYEAATAAYNNDLITAPADGMVTFVDSHLEVGEAVTANKTAITIVEK